MMNLSEVYPEPAEVVANELDTLKFLMDSAFIQETYPELATDAKEAFFRNTGATSFAFESHIDVKHEGYRRRILIGGFLILDGAGNYDNVSYYATVCCEANSPSHILRKFHFDLAIPGRKRRRPHPLFHLQYCGKLSPRLAGLGFSVQHMESWMSEPRLWHAPTSVALLLHCLFREFRDEMSHKLSERTEWRMLVKNNENLLLRPYFRKSSDFLCDEDRKTKLFTDFLYVP